MDDLNVVSKNDLFEFEIKNEDWPDLSVKMSWRSGYIWVFWMRFWTAGWMQKVSQTESYVNIHSWSERAIRDQIQNKGGLSQTESYIPD